MTDFATMYDVRDAITAHLGEAKARDLGIEVTYIAYLDAIEVRTPTAGFVITHRALADDSWRANLAASLDGLVQAAPEPATASPGSSQEGRD